VVAVVALIWNGDSFPDNVAPANPVALSQPLNRRHGVGAFAGVVATQQAQEFYEPVSQLRLGKPDGVMPSALSPLPLIGLCELPVPAAASAEVFDVTPRAARWRMARRTLPSCAAVGSSSNVPQSPKMSWASSVAFIGPYLASAWSTPRSTAPGPRLMAPPVKCSLRITLNRVVHSE